VIWRFRIFATLYTARLAKVQDFALTMCPIFTYFTPYHEVEIHGPARSSVVWSSDVLRVTFACKREYFRCVFV